MLIQTSSRPSRPQVVVIGVWDPLTSVNKHLFGSLARSAEQRGLGSLAVTLEPAPASYLRGFEGNWPVHSDLAVRHVIQKQCGVQTNVTVSLDKPEIRMGAKYFLERLCQKVRIEELWLGNDQTLGPLGQGSQNTVRLFCERIGARLRILPPITIGGIDAKRMKQEYRALLGQGQLAKLNEQVGHPPIWQSPPLGRLSLAWPPGEYQVIAYDCQTRSPIGRPFSVELTATDTRSSLSWPDPSIAWLAFLHGPGDTTNGD